MQSTRKLHKTATCDSGVPIKYESLARYKEIRLLRIQPGSSAEPLKCELVHVCLNDEPEYEALSYTWGNIDIRGNIICNGTDISVTTNLFSALRLLRLADQDRMLWTDAICINQQDVEEVSQQVSMMGDIYRHAKQVAIYLGGDEPGDEKAFELLDILATAQEKTKRNSEEGLYQVMDPSKLRELGVPSVDVDAPEWTALVGLFRRPYFGRMWIQQEVALSSDATVFCGKFERPWKHFADASLFLLQSTLAQEIGLVGLGSCVRVEAYRDSIVSGKTTTYYQTVQGCRNSLCTNPRDKIYAILGMITEPGNRFDTFNYSAEVGDVYASFTTFLINKEKSLKILGAREDPMLRTQKELPSWVTDWTVQCLTRQLGLITKYSNFRTAGDTIPKVSLLEGNLLSVRGAIMDTVEDVGSYFQARYSAVDDIAVPHDWQELMVRGPSYPTGENKWLVLFNILICAQRQLFPSFSCWFRKNHGQALSDEVGRMSRRELVNNSRSFLFNMVESSNGTSFLKTVKGYAGTCPRSTKPQDLVCIFDGGPMPFILRPTKQEKNCYELIGECYIHGIMDGEAVVSGDLLYQEFLLC